MEVKSKGFYFSFDAMLALVLVLGIMVLLTTFELTSNPLEEQVHSYTDINMVAEDTLQLMSYQKLDGAISHNEFDNYVANSVLEESDQNLTVLEAIAVLWAGENESLARNLTEEYLTQIIPSQYNYRVLVTDSDGETVIYNNSEPTNESTITVAKRIVSGLKRSVPRTGYVAKVTLSEVNKIDNHFEYFGGYVGDGNITLNVSLENMNNVFDMVLELDASNPFDVYVNNHFAGTYTPSTGNLSADSFLMCNETVNPTYCNYLENQNRITFNFSQFPAYIGGGFLKIRYNSTKNISLDNQNYEIKYEKLPGIKGIINLFSSFYVPGTLNSIEAKLHYLANYSLFLNIGNVTIFEKNSTGSEETINLTNAQIMGNLSAANFPVNQLNSYTIPFRLGFSNISTSVENIGADVALVTDVSGSMEWCTSGTSGSQTCSDWYEGPSHLIGNRWETSGCEKKIDVAKEAGKTFVNVLLNNSGNRIGLVDYTNSYGGCTRFWSWYYCYVCESGHSCGWNQGNPGCVVPYPDGIAKTIDLTNDNSTLQTAINTMETWWGTCTCCGVNKALDMLESQSNTTKFRGMVIMSDGEATDTCSEQGTHNAKNDAILAAQTACAENISVYTVGFGADADEDTLRDMACNDSMYYNAQNVNELMEIYKELGDIIIQASYSAQTVEVSGDFSTENVLYPDSYIKFNYTPEITSSFGKIKITQETDPFGGVVESPKNFSFSLPTNTQITDVKVTSYSSNYWTDRILTKNQSTGNYSYAYKLWDFGDEYTSLGDPYTVQIPLSQINSGNNELSLNTAANRNDTFGGSPDDRVIYTLLVSGYVPYGNSFEKAEGGTKVFSSELGNFTIALGNTADVWDPSNDSLDDAVQRLMNKLDTDNNNLIDVKLGSSSVDVESLAIGKIPWMWGPAEIRIEVWK